jgi:hypothetical protein
MQCLTAAFDKGSAEHVAAKRDIELGNGLPGIRTTAEVDQALKDAGFEVRAAWPARTVCLTPTSMCRRPTEASRTRAASEAGWLHWL